MENAGLAPAFLLAVVGCAVRTIATFIARLIGAHGAPYAGYLLLTVAGDVPLSRAAPVPGGCGRCRRWRRRRTPPR